MSQFRALRVHREAEATVCREERIDVGMLSDGEVEIDVQWSSVNYKDALAVTGRGRILRRFPCVPGIDLAGHVRRSDDPSFTPGQAVLVTGCGIGEALDGGYAERARVPAKAVIPLPPSLALRQAMALGTAGFTAGLTVLRLLDNRQTPDLGPILVTGASGGVGSITVDILAGLGFEVVAMTSKADAAERLRRFGASEVVGAEVLGEASRPLESARWGGVVDNLGGSALSALTRQVRPYGNIASIGLARDIELNTTVLPFILRGVSLIGIHSVECPRPLRERVWQQLADAWRPRHLDEMVTRTLDLSEVPAYCQQLLDNQVIGRALVQLEPDAG